MYLIPNIKICLQCHLPARTYLIPSQISPDTRAAKLCWMYRIFASRDFPELSCLFWVFLSLPVSSENYFLFLYLFKTELCPFTDTITLHQTMCKWKCYSSYFRHLGLRDPLSQMHAALSQMPRGAQPSFPLLLHTVDVGGCSPPRGKAAQAWQHHR